MTRGKKVEEVTMHDCLLRDFFANGAPPVPEWYRSHSEEPGNIVAEAQLTAKWRYAYADAMLAARAPAQE
mgnify:CR=1 FL=1